MAAIAIIAPLLEDKWAKIEFSSRENLSIAYLASFLESRGYEVSMINAHARRLGNDQVVKLVREREHALIGVSCTSQKLYPVARDLVSRLRGAFPEAHICMGGIFPTLEAANILNDLPELDTVVVGEGEFPLLALADLVTRGVGEYAAIDGLAYRKDSGREVTTNPPRRIRDLSSLPFPRRQPNYDEAVQERFLRVLAGRGCHGQCAFCSIQRSYVSTGRVYRSPKNVVDELEDLVQRFGISYFTFFDDIFYDLSPRGREWIEGFISEIRSRELSITFRIEMRVDDIVDEHMAALKGVGLRSVYLGVETGVPRLLSEMKKKATVEDARRAIDILRRHGIAILLGYITLIPTMSFDELVTTYEFLFEIGGFEEQNLYNKLNIYNGCGYEKILRDKGLLTPKTHFWERHNYRFSDERVALFSRVIDRARTELVPARVMLNEAKRASILNGRTGEYGRHETANVELWTGLARRLLQEVEGLQVVGADVDDMLLSRLREPIDAIMRHAARTRRLLVGDSLPAA